MSTSALNESGAVHGYGCVRGSHPLRSDGQFQSFGDGQAGWQAVDVISVQPLTLSLIEHVVWPLIERGFQTSKHMYKLFQPLTDH